MNLGHFIASFFAISIIAVSTGISALLFETQPSNTNMHDYAYQLKQREYMFFANRSSDKTVSQTPSSKNPQTETPNRKDLESEAINASEGNTAPTPETIRIEKLSMTPITGWAHSIETYTSIASPQKNEYDITLSNTDSVIEISMKPISKNETCIQESVLLPENTSPVSNLAERYSIGSDYIKYTPLENNQQLCEKEVFATNIINGTSYTVAISATKGKNTRIKAIDNAVTSFLTEISEKTSFEA